MSSNAVNLLMLRKIVTEFSEYSQNIIEAD